MSDTDTDETMETRLRYVLDRTNDWLRFAEAKNATLVATSLAAAFGFARLAADVTACDWWWMRYYLYCAVALLVFAAAASLTSLTPLVDRLWAMPRTRPHHKDNVLFFGDAARYGDDSYIQALYDMAGSKVPPTTMSKLYAHQIVTNARIALKKYRAFNGALWFALAALLTPAGAIVVYTVGRLRRKEGFA